MKKFFFLAVFAVVLCVMFGCSSSKSETENASREDLNNQLYTAVMHDDLEAAKVALEAGANVSCRDIYGRTPVFIAESLEMLSLLKEYGADVNSQEPSGYTPLLLSCLLKSDGYAERVKVLLEAGANPNARNLHGRSAMHYRHDANVVKLLIDYGGDVNAQDENGITPLRNAICRREFDLIQLLLDAGADPDLRDKTGKSSREYALEHKCCEFVQGSMIKIEDPTRGATQKMLQAIPDENIEAMKTALEEGVDPNWIEFEVTLLYMSVHYSPKVTKVLLDASADPNAINGVGDSDTPLRRAVELGKVETAKLLLDAGADPNAIGYGDTPLRLAVKLGKVEIAKLLLEAGADPNICPAGYGTPVFYADEPELIHLLKQYGGDMNFTVDTIGNGITPLIWQAKWALDTPKDIKVLSALLEAGADPDARDAEGKSARDYANKRGIKEIKKLFRQH